MKTPSPAPLPPARIPTGPDDPYSKGFDRIFDPTYGCNSLNGFNLTGAPPNAPVSDLWFQTQFEELVTNAYPPFGP